jgi:hypothetical protein
VRAVAALVLGIALACPPPLALAQSLPGAQSFVRELYRPYAWHGQGPDYLGAEAGKVFSPRLLELIKRDQRLTPDGDVPALDGDPLCDCQDPGGFHALHVEVSAAGAGRATAHVSFRLDTEPRALTLDLVSVHGQWRIDDVHDKDTPSLARFLIRAHPPKRRG